MKRVTGSDVPGAMKLIADRAEPARQDPRTETFSFTRVCLDECKPGHPSYRGNLALPGRGSLVELAGEDPAIIPDGGITPDPEPPEATT
jgi:hypothetical protein